MLLSVCVESQGCLVGSIDWAWRTIVEDLTTDIVVVFLCGCYEWSVMSGGLACSGVGGIEGRFLSEK